MKKLLFISVSVALLSGCVKGSHEDAISKAVESQQQQYEIAQPTPVYDWSIERDLVIQLYNIRNMRAITHSVWRSDYGLIEGDCASIGFGIPFDTSLTNPLANKMSVKNHGGGNKSSSWGVVEQPEPNGIFASKNTTATWVMCAGENGQIDPVYVESKVTAYPYPVSVDYNTNRVVKSGKSSVSITIEGLE
jgi:hypothetical protein